MIRHTADGWTREAPPLTADDLATLYARTPDQRRQMLLQLRRVLMLRRTRADECDDNGRRWLDRTIITRILDCWAAGLELEVRVELIAHGFWKPAGGVSG